MTKNYKVSLLIPTYNQEKYIKKAIYSALEQDYPNIEVIVSDDNSTDSTEQIVNELFDEHPKLKYFKNETNLGRVKNYHKALYENATGDLALNIDADDYLIDPTYISKAVKLFQDKDELVLVFAKKKTFVEKTNTFIEEKSQLTKDTILEGNSIFLNYYKGQHISHLTSLYKRAYAMEIGYYQENIQSSDWDSVLRLILNKKVGFINKTVGVWRKHAENASKEINTDGIISNTKFIENAFNKASFLKIAKAEVLSKWREKMLTRMFFNFLVKTHYLAPNKVKELKSKIRNYDKHIFTKVEYNLKYIAFKLVFKRRRLVKFVFKHILKKEFFVSDL